MRSRLAIALICGITSFVFLACGQQTSQPNETHPSAALSPQVFVNPNFRIVGTLYGNGATVDFAKVTHINFNLATILDTHSVQFTAGTDATTVINRAHALTPQVKVLLNVTAQSKTGWVALGNKTATNRKPTMDQIMNIVTTYGFDGVNLELMTPYSSDGSSTPWQNIVTDLNARLKPSRLITADVTPAAKVTGTYPFTFSYNAGEDGVTSTAINNLDWINAQVWDGQYTGGANDARAATPYKYFTTSWNYWRTQRSVTANKIVLGIPAFANDYSTYSTITGANARNAYRNTDYSTTNPATSRWYDGVASVQAKTQFVLASGGGGVMMRALSFDRPSFGATAEAKALINSIHQAVKMKRVGYVKTNNSNDPAGPNVWAATGGIDWSKVTHVNFQAARLVSAPIVAGSTSTGAFQNAQLQSSVYKFSSTTDDTAARDVVLQSHAKGAKVLLTLGADKKQDWVSAGATSSSRQTLVNNVLALVREYDFDGVDADYELSFPLETLFGSPGGQYYLDMQVPDGSYVYEGSGGSQAYLPTGYTNSAAVLDAIVSDLANALRLEGKLFTSAVHSGVETNSSNQYYDSIWDGAGISTNTANQIDWLNVMIYDDDKGPKHVAMDFFTKSWEYWTQKRGVTPSLGGVNPVVGAKIVPGIGFYAVNDANVIDKCNSSSSDCYYRDLILNFGANASLNVVYVTYPSYNGNRYYNGTTRVTDKANYAKTNGAGGIMMFELGYDVPTSNSASVLSAIWQVTK